MNWKIDQKEILFFTRTSGKKSLFNAFVEKEIQQILVHTVQSDDEIRVEVLNSKPGLILIELSVDFGPSPELLEFLSTSLPELFIILIIDPCMEQEAISFSEIRNLDYIFRDRLGKLPLMIRKNCHAASSRRAQDLSGIMAYQENYSGFRRLLEHSTDAIAVIEPAGGCSYASSSIEKILGYTASEFRAINLYELVHQEDRIIIEEEMFCCFEMPGISVQSAPVRVLHARGHFCWMEVGFTNLLDDPIIKGVMLVFRDLTRYKKAELAIKENENKYRSFFENCSDGILLTVTGGEILAANPAAENMFGMSQKEILKAGQTVLIDSDDPRLKPAIAEREQRGKVKAELRFVRKGGAKFEGELTSSVFKDAEGRNRTSIIIRDISGAKKAAEELKRSEEKYRNLFQYNPLASVIYNQQDFSITAVNEAAVNLYGYGQEEFLKKKLTDLLLDPDVFQGKRSSKETGAEEYMKTEDVQHLTKHGRVLNVEVHSHRLDFDQKCCRIAVINDVTAREAVLAELQEKKNKLKMAQHIAKLGYWEFDPVRKELFCSDQIYEIWEKEKGSFTPSADYFLRTLLPESRKLFEERSAGFSKKWIRKYQDYQILLENGKIKWIRTKAVLPWKKRSSHRSLGGTVQDITEQKLAQENLRISEVRHRAILMSQTNYLLRFDLRGRVTYCNRKFRKDFGSISERHDVLGENGLFSVREYHREKVRKTFMQCLQKPNQVYQVEIDKKQKDQSQKTTLWDMVCLTDQEGEPMEVQCVGIDITERVRAEKSLKESNARYEIVSKATSDAIYDWDCRTGKIIWSEGYRALFGHQPDSDIQHWAAHVHPDEKHEVTEGLDSALRTGKSSWKATYQMKKADGNYALVSEHGSILRDKKGSAFRMVGAIKDITEQKKYQEKLEKKEANLLTAQKIARMGYWEFDLRNKKVFWSEYAFKVWKRPREKGQPSFKTLIRRVPLEDRAALLDEFKAALISEKEHNIEHRIITSEGETRWVHQRGRSISDETGKAYKIEGTVQDITERKIADENLIRLNKELKTYTQELISANKGLEQFSYIVSHNLRSPVANIVGLSDLVAHGGFDEENQKSLLNELFLNVKRLDNVIIDLNTILQLKKKISEKKEVVHLSELVRSIEASIGDQIHQQDVRLSTSFEEVDEIHTVASYMHSIFYNLITNSIKYRRSEVAPEIRIRSTRKNADLVIAFEDNGLGIDLLKKGDQVFGLYKRFHHHVEGKGIGLFMVKTQVETLGGAISVSSEPGKGTIFELTFRNSEPALC